MPTQEEEQAVEVICLLQRESVDIPVAYTREGFSSYQARKFSQLRLMHFRVTSEMPLRFWKLPAGPEDAPPGKYAARPCVVVDSDRRQYFSLPHAAIYHIGLDRRIKRYDDYLETHEMEIRAGLDHYYYDLENRQTFLHFLRSLLGKERPHFVGVRATAWSEFSGA